MHDRSSKSGHASALYSGYPRDGSEESAHCTRLIGLPTFHQFDRHLQFTDRASVALEAVSRHPASVFDLSARDAARFGQLFLDRGR